MKRLGKIILGASLIIGVSITTASADVVKGQKLFAKKLKSTCNMTGAKFAAKHTQDEWSSIMNAGKFKDEINNICGAGAADDIKDSWIEHIYDFSHNYASDSGNVPSC